MSKTRVFIIGDSHTDAVKHALKLRDTSEQGAVQFEAYRYSTVKNGKMIGDLSLDAIVDRISALDSTDLIISTIGGNQHQTLSLVQHPTPFDLYESNSPPALSDEGLCTTIPRAQMWDYLEKGIRGGDGKRMQHLRANARCQVYHLSPPPPKEDAAHILRRFETKFAEIGLLEKGVTPAALRLKMWRLQVEVLRHLTTEFGIGLLPPPENSLSDTGFLDPAFYANDATHGNTAYGVAVLNQIETIARNAQA
ncbi:MAG: hypothetical protein CFE39_05470 [Comamonadaceae bacterium PBBC2]|nr:MAG: hypothetical protein CFE39_05470 [Comamonadaceae bacterium PBBC2]